MTRRASSGQTRCAVAATLTYLWALLNWGAWYLGFRRDILSSASSSIAELGSAETRDDALSAATHQCQCRSHNPAMIILVLPARRYCFSPGRSSPESCRPNSKDHRQSHATLEADNFAGRGNSRVLGRELEINRNAMVKRYFQSKPTSPASWRPD